MLCDSVLFNCFLAVCMQVFKIAYCNFVQPQYPTNGRIFARILFCAVKRCFPELMNKRKIHYLLHLVDNMSEFGPCSAFAAERCVCVCVCVWVVLIHVRLFLQM